MIEAERLALRQKYAQERDKRLRPDGNDQYLEFQGQFSHLLDDPYTPAGRARSQARPRDVRLRRRRLRRAGDRRQAQGGRRRGRPDRGEGRRLRRHLVLEPLPRRAVRHLRDDLHAAARGNRAYADGEVRTRAGDPRALRPDRQAVRPVRQRPVPHRGHRPGVGRFRRPLDRADEPGRRVHRPVRGDRHRAAARREAAGHPRHRDLRGPRVPHQPLGLRLYRRRPGRRADGPPGRQAGRDHRDRRDRHPVRPASGECVRGAVRLPADAVVGGRAGQPADRPGVVRRGRRARLAGALAGELRRQHGRRRVPRRGPGQRRMDRPGQADPRPDHGSRARARPECRNCWPTSRSRTSRR